MKFKKNTTHFRTRKWTSRHFGARKRILIKGVGFSSQFADYALFIRRRIILIELTKNGMVCYAKINVKMVEKMFMLYIPATLAPKVCMHGYWTLTFFLGGGGWVILWTVRIPTNRRRGHKNLYSISEEHILSTWESINGNMNVIGTESFQKTIWKHTTMSSI